MIGIQEEGTYLLVAYIAKIIKKFPELLEFQIFKQIKQLKAELEYYKKNSVMICGMSDEDDELSLWESYLSLKKTS